MNNLKEISTFLSYFQCSLQPLNKVNALRLKEEEEEEEEESGNI